LELFILIGGFLSAFAYKMLQDEGSIFKIFIAGPSLFLIGISFLFFSGGNITIAGILGIAIAFYFIKF
jgi:hypothetical protein